MQPIAAVQPHSAWQPISAAWQPLAAASQPRATTFACKAALVREATRASVCFSAAFTADTLPRAAAAETALAKAAVPETTVTEAGVTPWT